MKLIACAFVALLVVLITSIPAAAMRCGSYLVSPGDTKGEVLFKCGEPVSHNTHEEQVREGIDQGREVRTTYIFDDWVYNFGPDQLLQIVTFRNGRVFSLRTGDYGFPSRGTDDTCRHGQLLKTGETVAEVELKCGPPADRESRADVIVDTYGTSTSLRREIAIDEWMYNFGPDYFILYLRFENGRLVDIDSGGYGY